MYKQNVYHRKCLLSFLKLGQHDACHVKLFPSEVIGCSNCIEVALNAELNSEINNSYIFGLCIIISL